MNGAPTIPAGGIAARIAQGASLSVLGSLATRLLGIASIAVLGRLLLPEDFGVLATAMIFIGLFEALTARQFDLALIRTAKVTRRHFDTAFTLSLLWGCAAAALIFFNADGLAALMGEPALAEVLRWLSVVPLIEGLRNPRFVEFERGLSFLPDIGVNFAAKLLQALIAIALAFALRSYWAMVVGYLAFSASRVVMTHALRPARPGLSLAHAGSFLHFGLWLSGTGLLGFVMQKSDTALISARLGSATVGLFHMGSELVQMATHYLAVPISRTVYPGLAAVAGDRARLCRAYFRAQEMMMGVLLPIGFGAALLAPEIILVLVGPKWDAAVPVLQILAPAQAASLLVYNVQSLLMVDGDTRAMFTRNLIVALVQVPLIALGLWWLGLIGALGARVLAIALHTALTLRIAARLTGRPALATLAAPWRSFAACAVMALGVIGLDLQLATADTTLAALMLGGQKAALGALLYAATHLVLWLASGRPDGFETLALRTARRVAVRLLSRIFRRPA